MVGAPVDAHLSWQAVGSVGVGNLHFEVRARSFESGQVLWEQAADPLQPLPPLWPAGQVYRLTHRITPQATSPEAADVQLDVCAVQGGETLACGPIGRPRVIDQPAVVALPRPPQNLTAADWDGQLSLAGYDLARELGKMALTLYWQVERAPAGPLKRFVHAVDPAGQIVAQADDIPANGALPMPFWRAGEFVVDRVELQPGEAGVTSLCVGWYQPDSGERVPVMQGAQPAPERQVCLPVD